jgi:hypothetical protein
MCFECVCVCALDVEGLGDGVSGRKVEDCCDVPLRVKCCPSTMTCCPGLSDWFCEAKVFFCQCSLCVRSCSCCCCSPPYKSGTGRVPCVIIGFPWYMDCCSELSVLLFGMSLIPSVEPDGFPEMSWEPADPCG